MTARGVFAAPHLNVSIQKIMKPLESPYDIGEVEQRENKYFFSKIKSLFSESEFAKYVKSLKRQMKERGCVRPECWSDPERAKVAKEIEFILSEINWGEKFSFHPDDPYYIVGEWETGDLSELEAILAIEEQYSIEISDGEIDELLNNKSSFGNFVDMVLKKIKVLANNSMHCV